VNRQRGTTTGSSHHHTTRDSRRHKVLPWVQAQACPRDGGNTWKRVVHGRARAASPFHGCPEQARLSIEDPVLRGRATRRCAARIVAPNMTGASINSAILGPELGTIRSMLLVPSTKPAQNTSVERWGRIDMLVNNAGGVGRTAPTSRAHQPNQTLLGRPAGHPGLFCPSSSYTRLVRSSPEPRRVSRVLATALRMSSMR